jgi:hypothetical protein
MSTSIPHNSLTRNSPKLKLLLSRPTLEAIRDERCKRDPLYWAQRFTATENPHYLEQGREFVAPFPGKSYFRVLFDALAKNRSAEVPNIFIPKTREMVTSWSVMVYATHAAQWKKAEVIVQTDSEDKAMELVGYAECLYRCQPGWLKVRHPLKRDASTLEVQWADGGRVLGIPKGVNKIRIYHPTIYIMDEAAFLPEAQQCYDAAQPVAKQIIAISSAGPGWFGDECSI